MATNSFAQKEIRKNKKVYFSIGTEFAVPAGDFRRISGFGIGGSALLEIKASAAVAMTLSVCHIHYVGKKISRYRESAVEQLSALIGGRYYFDRHFFASGQIGFNTHQDDYAELGGSAIIAPGIGYKVSLLDATLKYMGAKREYTNFSSISLRLAIVL